MFPTLPEWPSLFRIQDVADQEVVVPRNGSPRASGYLFPPPPYPIAPRFTTQHPTGEDLAEGASFWHAFLTPFWGPETIVMFKRNYVEAMFRLSQIQDKPSKSFDQNQPDITFVKKLVQSTNVFEAKGYMTNPKQKNK